MAIRILASRFLRPRVTAIFASFLDRRRISSRVRLLRLSVYLNNLFDRKLDLRWTERERVPPHIHQRCWTDGYPISDCVCVEGTTVNLSLDDSSSTLAYFYGLWPSYNIITTDFPISQLIGEPVLSLYLIRSTTGIDAHALPLSLSLSPSCSSLLPVPG